MLLGAVALHRLLQLLESCRRVLRIDFGTQCRDLMLQIVRKPTKRFDVLLRLQVLLMLAFQLRVDRREFRIASMRRACSCCAYRIANPQKSTSVRI